MVSTLRGVAAKISHRITYCLLLWSMQLSHYMEQFKSLRYALRPVSNGGMADMYSISVTSERYSIELSSPFDFT
jgi:hypothetical protein